MSILENLAKIHAKRKYFGSAAPKSTIPQIVHPIINKYPKWVATTEDYLNFGKFVDYCIRKMIACRFPEKVIFCPTQAETVDAELDKTVWVTTTAEKEEMQKIHPDWTIVQSDEAVKINGFILNRKDRIRKYRNQKIQWQECIADLYYLAVLDRFYEVRTEIPLNPKVTPALVKTAIPYLDPIDAFISTLFADATHIYLNPNLYVEKMISGEADLIVIFPNRITLYDIKVTWNTKKCIRKYFWQIISYAALHQYLCYKTPEHPLNSIGRIDSVGFIFPNQLIDVHQSISKWKDVKRHKFIVLLKKSQFWKKGGKVKRTKN